MYPHVGIGEDLVLEWARDFVDINVLQVMHTHRIFSPIQSLLLS